MKDKKHIRLRNMIMYFIYCLKFEEDIGSCKSHARYKHFLENEIDIHIGDCVKFAASCMRCQYQEMEIECQKILNSMQTRRGWCGDICNKECTFCMESKNSYIEYLKEKANSGDKEE